MSLTMVTSRDDQKVLAQLLVSEGSSKTGRAWLSGKRSDDTTWKDFELKPYTEISSTDTEENCAIINTDSRAVNPSKCIANEYKMTVCQLDQPADGCSKDQISLSGHCFFVPHNWTNTWLGGQQICQIQSPSGTLAYSDMTAAVFTIMIREAVREVAEQHDSLWVGVRRRPWVWVTGDATESAMLYHQWSLPAVEIPPSGAFCISVGLGDRQGYWKPAECEGTVDYYVCMGDRDKDTLPPANSKGDGGGLSDINIIIIACVCAGILLIIIIVIVVVIVKRRRRKSRAQQAPKEAEYSYPRDTYGSAMATVAAQHKEDRELGGRHVDLVKAADSVRHAKPRERSSVGDGEQVKYKDVFMVEN